MSTDETWTFFIDLNCFSVIGMRICQGNRQNVTEKETLDRVITN